MHAIDAASRPADEDISDLLTQLLAQARAVLGSDPRAADRCLGQAANLLEVRAAGRAPRLVGGGLAPWQANRVRAHVEANLTAILSIAELAALARLSPSRFSQAFKASFGCPPHAFVVTRRLARAQQLMLTTPEPLSEIALMCGLSDQAHFSHLFRRHVGDSPAAWRRARLAGPPADDEA